MILVKRKNKNSNMIKIHYEIDKFDNKELLKGYNGIIKKEFNNNNYFIELSEANDAIDEIVKAAFAMGRTRTGALMVLERNETLVEYEKTGIVIDAVVSSQLLINIFEHNTPLHDGAVIIRGDRVMSATCYLPLSDNRSLSKALGTRHRAAVGISEATDSLTVIVSEENGKVSVAYGGELFSGLNQEGLREKLEMVQDKPAEEVKKGWRNKVKGDRNEKKADE